MPHSSIHSSIHGHLGWFHVSAVMNNAALDMGGQISLQESDFVLFRSRPRRAIAGSQGGPISNFFEESPYHLLQWLQPTYTAEFLPAIFTDPWSFRPRNFIAALLPWKSSVLILVSGEGEKGPILSWLDGWGSRRH